MTRVAVVADTHLPRGARRLPEACAARLREADLIVHAGDLSSLAFLGELRALGPPVAAVAGNADEPALRELLPAERVVEAGGARIGVVHDPGPRGGRGARLVRRFPGCDAVVYGHTHVAEVRRERGVWLLNPGSPTERRRASVQHSMLVVEIDHGVLAPRLIAV